MSSHPSATQPIAYFSMEFGMEPGLPIYSGGLGILAGDHLKAADEAGLPLVGLGLLYRRGYFRQSLREDAWQRELPQEWDPAEAGLEELDFRVGVETAEGPLRARVWRRRLETVELLLLDTDLDENPPALREIGAQLYGGERRERFRQEMLLGLGGMEALEMRGRRPSRLHLNEGHVALALLGWARWTARAEDLDFAGALARVRARTLFTTHTPVEAGHERYAPGLVREELAPLAAELGVEPQQLLELGLDAEEQSFCMTTLSLRQSAAANGVSRLHGRVARGMWHHLWPEGSEDEVPIGHVTNGVHLGTWLSPEMAALFDLLLKPNWRRRAGDPKAFAPLARADDAMLWKLRGSLRRRLIEALAEHRPACLPEELGAGFDPEALTVGFARRFAPYKRSLLLLEDPDRLAALLGDRQRPVQFVFAGKAHPRNEEGKYLMQRLLRSMVEEPLRGRFFFLENYDMEVARLLVQGADLWLNLPRRPHEASGTSGMKAALNGALNASILDGWWDEAFDGENGFAVGGRQEPADPGEQDRRDREALFALLEDEILPLFYERDEGGLPRAWLARVRHALATLPGQFSAARMVGEYRQKLETLEE